MACSRPALVWVFSPSRVEAAAADNLERGGGGRDGEREGVEERKGGREKEGGKRGRGWGRGKEGRGREGEGGREKEGGKKGREGDGGKRGGELVGDEGGGGRWREVEGGACVTQYLRESRLLIITHGLLCIVGHSLCNTSASVLPVCISSCNLSAELF